MFEAFYIVIDCLDLKGLTKWIERIQWLVDSYVNYRKELPDNPSKTNEELTNYYAEAYNYHVLQVSLCVDLLHLHNTAIMNLQGFTSSLRKMEPSELGSSQEAERCIHALVVMLQPFAPNTASEMWNQLSAVTPYNPQIRKPGKVTEQVWPVIDKDAEIEFIIRVGRHLSE